jgi:hypothetical protein
MAGEFDKLFGPKVPKEKPQWPSGVGVGLIPNSIHPSYNTWPFLPSPSKSVLPNKSGLKRAE